MEHTIGLSAMGLINYTALRVPETFGPQGQTLQVVSILIMYVNLTQSSATFKRKMYHEGCSEVCNADSDPQP